MFGNLIESGSHAREFRRRGYFLLATLGFYAALLSAAGVGSIYAYNARLDEQNLEVLTLLRFPPAPSPVEPQRRAEPQRPAARSGGQPRALQRAAISLVNPHLSNRAVAGPETPDAPPRVPVQLGNENFTPLAVGLSAPGGRGNRSGTGDAGNAAGPRVIASGEEEAPEMTVKPEPRPRKPQSLGVINGRASYLPQPVYSPIAKAAHAQGPVTVQVSVDEEGRVVSAQATNGHPLLRPLAVQAALRARFTPTLLSKQPVKVSGFITYNFVLQ